MSIINFNEKPESSKQFMCVSKAYIPKKKKTFNQFAKKLKPWMNLN